MNRRTMLTVVLPVSLAIGAVVAGMIAVGVSLSALQRNWGAAHEPAAFTSIEGKTCWKVAVGQGDPLATPAIDNNQVLVGGGFVTYRFHAFDAITGKSLWNHATSDNGPSAAVVYAGHIVYNTESCELEVLTTAGNRIWTKWLGDPLMSAPTVGNGRIYTSYPKTFGGGGYQLACFDLRTGAEIWQRPIANEIITSAALIKDRLYFATVDGTLACVEGADGAPVWQEQADAMSSPQIVGERCYFQRRILDQNHPSECLAWRGIDAKGTLNNVPDTMRGSASLEAAARSQANDASYYSSLDRSVGWSSGMSSLDDARRNLSLSSVAAVWSFQGSRPFVDRGRLYRAVGKTVQCVDPAAAKVLWTQELPGAGTLTPPALANGKIFVGSTAGTLLCLSTADGSVLWQATLGEAVSGQVAVAHGRVYVPTRQGNLFCIETGDANDHGWLMWAGNPAHTGDTGREPGQ